MRRIIFLTVAAVLLSPCTVWADLMVQEHKTGEKVTLDTNTGYYWYWNLHDFVSMDYATQILEIAGLGTYGNIAGGWHLATRADMDTLWNFYSGIELADAFGGTWEEGMPWEQLIGRYEEVLLPLPIHFTGEIRDGGWDKQPLGGPLTDDWFLSGELGAWVCTEQQVVPVPPAVILAATGLFSATLGLRRLRRKHQE